MKKNQKLIINGQLLRKHGFSLVEVLITLMVLSVGILAISALMTSNIKTSINAKNQIIASGLAQEGVELVRRLKENVPTFTTDVAINDDYKIDINSDYDAFTLSNNVDVSLKKLYLSGGVYTHTPGGTETKFLRKIKISDTATGSNKIVESIVSWDGATIPAGTTLDPCNVAKKCVSVQAVLPVMPSLFNCIGAFPSNASICASDGIGLAFDWTMKVVPACTVPTKCEYTCNSGYAYSAIGGGRCVKLWVCESDPTNIDVDRNQCRLNCVPDECY
jgi:prepilin-type N-terminal cleavage/methylation domain-containing protein